MLSQIPIASKFKGRRGVTLTDRPLLQTVVGCQLVVHLPMHEIDHLDEYTCWPDASRHWISVRSHLLQKGLTTTLLNLQLLVLSIIGQLLSEGDVLLFATASGNASFLLLLSLDTQQSTL